METSHALLVAFAFGSLWMLLWGTAVVIPIAVHLWHRRQHHVETWAAMEFLVAAIRHRARRWRFEQLALLANRVMILLLLAVTLANPVRSRSRSTKSASREPRHRLLVLDGSYSMAAKGQHQTAFDLAKREAAKAIENSADGDGYSIIWMGEPIQTVIGRPTFDRSLAVKSLQELKPGYAGANLSEGLARVKDIIRQSRRDHPQFVTHEVIWYTDLMHNTWGPLESADMTRDMRQLAEQVEVTVFDVGTAPLLNLAVTDLRSPEGFTTVGEVVTFQAVVRSYSSDANLKVRLEFHVDGQPIDQLDLLPAPATSQAVTFQHAFAQAGEHWVAVRLLSDALEVDNWRYCSLPVLPAIRVLCVSGHPHASRYLRTALRPDDYPMRPIKVDTISSVQLRETELGAYHAVFLSNVAGFDRHQARLLSDYSTEGGGLVFFLGDQVKKSQYVDLARAGPQVFPVRLQAPAAADTYRFDPREYNHPIVQPFNGQHRNGLLSTPVWCYYRVVPQPDAVPALWFENGDAAIVESANARGRTIVVTTAATDSSSASDGSIPWTAWPIWPSFPPCVMEILDRVIEARFHNRSVIIGEPISGSVGYGGIAEVVIRPDHPMVVPVDPTTGRWSLADTWVPGPLRCRVGDRDETYVINVDPQESISDRINQASFPESIRFAGLDVRLDRDADERQLPGQGLLPWCFAGILALLMLESFLGWQFGRVS